MFTAEGILEKYPTLEESFKKNKIRKYELQSLLGIDRWEADAIIGILTKEGLIENTSLGWRWSKEDK